MHDGTVVQQSGAIISYLEAAFPEYPSWEKFVDDEVGIAVRKVCYHILLDHPDILIPFFTRNTPWYGTLYMKLAFPRITARMRKLMNVNSEPAALADRKLGQGINKLYGRLQSQPFLVGDTFTQADLSAAALLASLRKRPEYGLEWPERFPEALEGIIGQYEDKLAWVHRFYENHHRKALQ